MHSSLDSIRSRSAPLLLAASIAFAVLPGAPPAMAQTAQPIRLSGWNKDTVFERPNAGGTSSVSQYFDFESRLAWAESGNITGTNVNGLPTSRRFNSTAYTDASQTVFTGSTFEFQPYDAPNTAYINGPGSVTLTLDQPLKFKSLAVLGASSSTHANWNYFRITLTFTDHAPVQLNYINIVANDVTIKTPDWGDAIFSWQTAISVDRVGHGPALTASSADPITGSQSNFGMFESFVDLTQGAYDLQQFTISTITFTKPPAYDNIVSAVYAVSGIPTVPAAVPEPAGAALLITGMLGLLVRRNRVPAPR